MRATMDFRNLEVHLISDTFFGRTITTLLTIICFHPIIVRIGLCALGSVGVVLFFGAGDVFPCGMEIRR